MTDTNLTSEISITPKIGAEFTYRGYTITFNYPPIPIRNIDYGFQHDEFSGDTDDRCGEGPSVQNCMEQIDEQILELRSEIL